MYDVLIESERLKKRKCSNSERKRYLKFDETRIKTKVFFLFNFRKHFYIFEQLFSIFKIKIMHRCEKCKNRRIAFYQKTSYVIFPYQKACIDAKSAEIDELLSAQNKLRYIIYRNFI